MIEPALEVSPRLLVIDDEPTALRLLRLVLSRHEYEVTACSSVNEALKFLDQNAVDLIITDSVMPDLTGIDLVRAVRAHPNHAGVPILMLTRRRQREDVNTAVIAGVTDYIIKPIDENLLVDKVELCLKKGEAERQVFEHQVSEANAQATLKLRATITTLSESDVTVISSLALDAGMHFSLDGPVFADIGIPPPLLRFLDCQLIERSTGDGQLSFATRYAFVGVPEADLKKIRAWLQRQELQRRK